MLTGEFWPLLHKCSVAVFLEKCWVFWCLVSDAGPLELPQRPDAPTSTPSPLQLTTAAQGPHTGPPLPSSHRHRLSMGLSPWNLNPPPLPTHLPQPSEAPSLPAHPRCLGPPPPPPYLLAATNTSSASLPACRCHPRIPQGSPSSYPLAAAAQGCHHLPHSCHLLATLPHTQASTASSLLPAHALACFPKPFPSHPSLLPATLPQLATTCLWLCLPRLLPADNYLVPPTFCLFVPASQPSLNQYQKISISTVNPLILKTNPPNSPSHHGTAPIPTVICNIYCQCAHYQEEDSPRMSSWKVLLSNLSLFNNVYLSQITITTSQPTSHCAINISEWQTVKWPLIFWEDL
ncbi:putative signal peptide protein [Puccinia sorghi]|uniref:Putative signal peptide protein n=1 Tax=Puccinia sorghi TaxID=27349 RepID=A0A0L6US74_9BASI|nr:putative signal peptide protein [Puccinia sorghi]